MERKQKEIRQKKDRKKIEKIQKWIGNEQINERKKKPNIAIAILEKLSFLKGNKNDFVFWGHQ